MAALSIKQRGPVFRPTSGWIVPSLLVVGLHRSCVIGSLQELAVRAADDLRPRERRHLREPRRRARPDLPRDRGDQLRPGRARDVHDLHRVAADRLGAHVLARVRLHARDRVRRRVARPGGRDPAGRARAGSQLTVVIASIGLLILVEGSIGWIWGNEIKFMPTPFPAHIYRVGGVAFSRQDISTIAISIAASSSSISCSSSRSSASRCGRPAVRPDAARLVGIRVSWMLSLGLGARGGARRGRRDDGGRQPERPVCSRR